MASTAWSKNFTFLPRGAAIQEFTVGGQNIVLGFEDPDDYLQDFNPYFGETIGRVANRIAGAKINLLNGKSYELAANNGINTNHGGKIGWGKKMFDGPHYVKRADRDAVHFTYLSQHDEEGFPGTVKLSVWYYPSVDVVDGKEEVTLEIEYEAGLVGDEVAETIINICNHSYFNLSGKPSIEGTIAELMTNIHQTKNEHDIPPFSLDPFPGISAGEPFTLGAEQPDVDHCFVMEPDTKTIPLDTRQRELEEVCNFKHPDSRIQLVVSSTEPAFQFYTGKYIDVPSRGSKPSYGSRSGFCVETGRFVDAINHDRWRQQVLLNKLNRYGSRTVYKASQY